MFGALRSGDAIYKLSDLLFLGGTLGRACANAVDGPEPPLMFIAWKAHKQDT